MDNSKFIEYCKAELYKSFSNTKSGKLDNTQRHRTEGLLHAAQLLEILNPSDIQSMIDSEHMDVFGESIESRKNRKEKITKLGDAQLDEYFDIPAIERRG